MPSCAGFRPETAGSIRRNRNNFRSAGGEHVGPAAVAIITANDPQRHGLRSADHAARQRQAETAVDDDADGRTVFEPRQTARQFRIVGQRRPDADQDSIVIGSQTVPPRTCHRTGYPT